MIEMVKTPWHLWPVGVLSLLWNGFGAFDFVQTTTRGEAYMHEMGVGDDMIAYYDAMPAWMYVPWTLGVWGALIGSILLLLRRRWAVEAFGVSLLGALVSLIYGNLIDPPPPAPPEMAAMSWMPFVILLIAVLLFVYAFNMRKRGVLR